MTRKINLAGNTYNFLTVLREGPKHSTTGRVQWLCMCNCGSEVVVAACNLTNGHTKSCGCHKLAINISRLTTHGMANKCPEYKTWKNIHNRCRNPRVRSYPLYGGRGITVCDEWADYENFYNDMGPRPGPEYSIERIDNDGPYSRENCKWATKTEQANNRRSNRFITVWGETLTLAQSVAKYAEPLGIEYCVVARRLQMGWAPEDALTRSKRCTDRGKPVTA